MQNKMQIYISKINPQLDPRRIDEMLSYVTAERKEQFYRFRFFEDSMRGLYGEILVRLMASQRFQIGCREIALAKNKYGRPYIKGLPVFFNVSHGGDWVACAMNGQNIGIDVEKIKKDNYDMLGTAKRFFHQKEYELLIASHEEAFPVTFYDLWTLKESYIKWLGLGLTKPLGSFCIEASGTQFRVRDESQPESPFFKQYSLTGHCLSVCSSTPDFPEQLEVIDMDNIILA